MRNVTWKKMKPMLGPGWSEERGTLDMFRLEDQVEFFHRMLRSKT